MEKLLIEESVDLSALTTFKLGGNARFFVSVTTHDQLVEAFNFALQKSLPTFVLGGGSNILFSSTGYQGLVIHLANTEISITGEKLTAGAGASMGEVVDKAIEHGLKGLEWAGGLPGTFGGAIRGNAGCFGSEIKDVIILVKTISTKDLTMRDWTNSESEFRYRDSYFKQNPTEVIMSATLGLSGGEKEQLRREADEHIEFRKSRHPLEYPNAGSVFKNVPLRFVPEQHLPLFAESIKNDPFPIVPAAKIIAVAGLKGLSIGGARVSEKHSNFIVNYDSAKPEDVVKLIRKVQESIHQKFGISLIIEQELVGF